MKRKLKKLIRRIRKMKEELEALKIAVEANTVKTDEVVLTIEELKAGSGAEEVVAATEAINANTEALATAIKEPEPESPIPSASRGRAPVRRR